MNWIDKPLKYIDPLEREQRKERKIRRDKGLNRFKYLGKLPVKYKSYLLRANKKQIPFTLSVKSFELLLQSNCVYCGGYGGTVDRIESSDGYTMENCAPCCIRCNMMKYTLSQKDFYIHVRKIYNHLNKNKSD